MKPLTFLLLLMFSGCVQSPTERFTVDLGNPTQEEIKAPVDTPRVVEGVVSKDIVRTDDPDTWTEHECLARNAYFEARGEGTHGMALVTQTVLNRVNSNKRYFPNTACQVVRQKLIKGCAYAWFCDGLSDRPRDLKAFEEAKKVATNALLGQYKDLVKVKYFKHCGFYSSFFNRLSYKFRYKNHCFYGEGVVMKIIEGYLGDGLYVSFDGYQLALKANHHEYPTDIVYLEPQVWENLVKFVERLKEKDGKV